MVILLSVVNGDTPALSVGGALDDEICAPEVSRFRCHSGRDRGSPLDDEICAPGVSRSMADCPVAHLDGLLLSSAGDARCHYSGPEDSDGDDVHP
jgi:hypothetical protein